jgi:hypothetical protein
MRFAFAIRPRISCAPQRPAALDRYNINDVCEVTKVCWIARVERQPFG